MRPPEPAELSRVSQLTLRTNQFHLAPERLQLPQVREWAERGDRRVLVVRARDRFGDHGLVGAVFLRRDAEDLHLDNYVLSCRVFSRGIESACLAAVLEHAAASGAHGVLARHRPTPRNAAFASFYIDHGFVPTGVAPDDPATVVFRHALRDITPAPAHLRLHTAFEEN